MHCFDWPWIQKPRETDSLFRQLQDAVAVVPDAYKKKVPLLYGCQSDRTDEMETDSD
jgi:hypothetical protein